MSSLAAAPRVTLWRLTWAAAWAVVLHAALARFLPAAGTLPWALVLAGVGALVRASPVDFPARRSAVGEAAAGAAWLVAGGLGLRALARATGGEGAAGLWLVPWIALVLLLALDGAARGRILRLLGVEWLKLRRSRLFLVGLAATGLVTLLAALTWEELPRATGWTRVSDALGAGQWAAEIFVLVLGATAIAGEATGGTLKMVLPHAYARSDWIRAKAAMLVLASVCFTLVAAGVSVGYAALGDGLGDVHLEIEESWSGGSVTREVFRTGEVMGGHLLAALAVGFAAMVATGCLGLVLSSLFDGVVAALCAAFLVFAGLKFADVVLSLSREGIAQTTMEAIYTWYPSEMRESIRGLGQGLSSAWWDETLLGRGLALALITGALALLLAVAAFARRDLEA